MASIQIDKNKLLADICRSSFEEFVRHFWECVPGACKIVWNWHLSILCKELEVIAERVFNGVPKEYDEVINISPGTSKSSICSILFPAWVWTRMPSARVMTASHTESLVLDLANKARDVIRSEKYGICFPEVKFAEAQDAKGYYRNTLGGDRYTCTVAGKSPMGFHGHFLICLPYESLIETNMGSIPIGKIVEEKLPVRVLSYNHNDKKSQWSQIEVYEENPGRALCKVNFQDGSYLELTEDHLVCVVGKGYILAIKLEDGDRVIGTQAAYERIVVSIERNVRIPRTVYNIKVAGDHNYFANGVLVHNCDDPIDPKKVLSDVELKTASEFMTDVISTRKVDKEVTVTILVMQRLGVDDPTDVVLEQAKKEGAAKVRHICLPGELIRGDDNGVYPKDLANRYTDGLMDPRRLSRRVLNEFKAKGDHFYATQILQRPYAKSGGLFKEPWFYINAPVRTAPFRARRIRYYDRASTEGAGCATSGVLIAEGIEDGKFYIEHVLYGHWEPGERNRRMLAQAHMDRNRYGEVNEPIIWVEREGGSSGRDAWLGIVRILKGFRVREHNITRAGSKYTRAEPWATQLEGGNVVIVNDGTWDVNGYIKEHVSFTGVSGKMDMVDASSGCFNRLVNDHKPCGTLRILPVHKRFDKDSILRILTCTKSDLDIMTLDDKHVLISIVDPPATGDDISPPNNPNRLRWVVLPFADINPEEIQDRWTEPLQPYGVFPEQLVITKDVGKRMWACLLKSGAETPKMVVITDGGANDRRAISVAKGISARFLTGKVIIGVVADDGTDWNKKEAPNKHIYDVIRHAREMVI